MIIDNKTITESAIIANYLADRFPSKLLPTSSAPEGPHVRSEINCFVDAYFSRVQSFWGKVLEAKTDAEEKAAAITHVEAVSREVEPLLSDAGPFFGGSETLTLAEVSFYSVIC
jgi:glutathione S-transferase